MEMKLAIPLLALLITTIAPPAHGAVEQSPRAVERWFGQLSSARQKVTNLHFFIHDIMTGDQPSTVPVAQANVTATSPTRFGLVYAMDSPLTEGPTLDSKHVGRCQGMITFASQKEFRSLLTLNLVFTDGDFSGSTLSILGPKRRDSVYREYPVVGGTGVFRLAQGVAVDHVYNAGPVAPGTRPPTECQVFVWHYGDDDDEEPHFAQEI